MADNRSAVLLPADPIVEEMIRRSKVAILTSKERLRETQVLIAQSWASLRVRTFYDQRSLPIIRQGETNATL